MEDLKKNEKGKQQNRWEIFSSGLKLIDFGSSILISGQSDGDEKVGCRQMNFGTRAYMSPEHVLRCSQRERRKCDTQNSTFEMVEYGPKNMLYKVYNY